MTESSELVAGTIQADSSNDQKSSVRLLTRAVAAALGHIFGSDRTFVKFQPVWLRNPHTGRVMTLHMYCDSLNLAVECVSGIEPELDNGMHQPNEARIFRAQHWLKKKMCNVRGITMIHVPLTIPPDAVAAFLRNALIRPNTVTVTVCH